VRAVPYIPLLQLDNVRTGFFEPTELERLLPHLEADLADFAAWCYTTGMRKGEAAALTWPMLDRSGAVWALKIPAAIAKNREGRSLPVVGPARAVIERRLKARRLDTPLISHRVAKGQAGQPIRAFDKAWTNALKKARLLKGRLFHDLRRSAARNLRRAGATETEAMRVTGHKTASMFRRYSIVTDDDVAAALRKQDAFLGRGKLRRS
jgi:integrase